MGEILVVNCGSSSIRLAAFDATATRRLWRARLENLGALDGRLLVEEEDGSSRVEAVDTNNLRAAPALVLKAVMQRRPDARWSGVGHRLVHGGGQFQAPLLIDAAAEQRLNALIRLAPLHMPANLAGIAAARERWPQAPQIACFDTAFHASLPEHARAIALPQRLLGEDVRRYGFHGLSYESIVAALRQDGVDLVHERIVAAHLGAGVSMCALKEGRSLETTMGFSTLAGLPMATRSGDIDPGALIHMLRERRATAEELERALYEESGLAALSGGSGDMKQLLANGSDPAAAQAVAVFCYQARRQIGALAGVLGGLDRLVFTGGIGLNAPDIRAEICAGLEFLGVELDAGRNSEGRTRISRRRSAVLVEARPTDEERIIARHVRAVLGGA